MEMEGKVVVVTGASMGIGEAIAKVFADQGASVVLLSRDASRAEAARQRIGHTERTFASACDVRNREEIDRALALTLHNFKRVDVWVNNAGVGIRASVADMAPSNYRELFETNFFGSIACLQAVVPAMREKGGGDIINISSVAGHIPVPFMAIYSASKFAMNAIGKGARVELKHDNINVLTVCPGYVSTEFGAHVVADSKAAVRPPSVRGISAERVAQATYRGYRQKKREVIVPWTMIPVIKLYQLLPGLVEWVMARAVPNPPKDKSQK
jgi:short-subunit dehydrogenase